MDRLLITDYQLRLLHLRRFLAAELNIVVILLLLFPLFSLIVWLGVHLTAGQYSEERQEKKNSFHTVNL
jgi:hypothetical protein